MTCIHGIVAAATIEKKKVLFDNQNEDFCYCLKSEDNHMSS